MPPKTPKPSNQWIKCEKCSYLLSKNELNMHSCILGNTNNQFTYIHNHTFYGLIQINEIEPKHLNFSEKSNIIFLSSSIIKHCNFQVGQYVEIKSDNFRLIKKVFPSSHPSITSCSLIKEYFDLYMNSIPQFVKVNPLKEKPHPAQEITIELRDYDIVRNKTFQENVKNLLQKNFYRHLILEGEEILLNFYGKIMKFLVTKIVKNYNLTSDFENLNLNENSSVYLIVNSTKWIVNEENNQIPPHQQEEISFAGYDNILEEAQNIIKLGFTNILREIRFKPKGILIFGPNGSGKSTLANKLAQNSKAFTKIIYGGEIFSKLFGETEKKLKEIFFEAENKSPSIIIIEDIEIFCPKKSSNSDQHKRVLATLLSLLDNLGCDRDAPVIVIATTSKLDDLDASIRRSGRFDQEFELSPPNPSSRLEILKAILSKDNHNISQQELIEIANRAHGFIAADLSLLTSKAMLHAAQNSHATCLSYNDFYWAFEVVKPSVMREVMIQVPKVKWAEIGGQEELKLKLEQAIVWPLKYPDSLQRFAINAPSGFLLFGPPGCSKTLIAKALATESKLNFLTIKGPEIFSKWVGESERAIRQLFRRARQVSPSIVFLDEIDAIAAPRSSGHGSSDVQARVLTQLLTEIDGVETLGNVIVIGATNRPDRIDPALLRPGRLVSFYVPLPDRKTRREIFKIEFSTMSISDDVNLEQLLDLTDGFSGAEVHELCQQAGWKALKENIYTEKINFFHFNKALQNVNARTPKYLLDLYNKFLNK